MTEILTTNDIAAAFDTASWQRVLFAEFESTLTSKSRPFPCVFGVTGIKSNQLRFAFLDPLDADTLAPVLADYLKTARSIGKMTSLVIFARPGPVQSIEAYRERFWRLLDGMERRDPAPRPAEIERALDTPGWEFCFGGEPIFVVCNTPAHVMRQSRRSTGFMITFQPRWVFEGITDTDDPAVLKALASVRERLHAFDAVSPSPDLGKYGDTRNREFRQYFIDDTNTTPACPFHSLGRPGEADSDNEGKVA